MTYTLGPQNHEKCTFLISTLPIICPHFSNRRKCGFPLAIAAMPTSEAPPEQRPFFFSFPMACAIWDMLFVVSYAFFVCFLCFFSLEQIVPMILFCLPLPVGICILRCRCFFFLVWRFWKTPLVAAGPTEVFSKFQGTCWFSLYGQQEYVTMSWFGTI